MKLIDLARELQIAMPTLRRNIEKNGIKVTRRSGNYPYIIADEDAPRVREMFANRTGGYDKDRPCTYWCNGCPAVNQAKGHCHATTDPEYWWTKTGGKSCEIRESIEKQERNGIPYADILTMTRTMPGYI